MESLGLEAGLELNMHCLGGFVWLGFVFPPFPVPRTRAVQAGQSGPGSAVLPASGGGQGALLPAQPVLSLLRGGASRGAGSYGGSPRYLSS